MRLFVLCLVLSIGGCASTQLNYNTVDIASSSDQLIERQVLLNLAKVRNSPFAIPAQVSVPSGSVSTTNQLNPTFGAPLGLQATTTVANTVASAFSATTTRTAASPNGTLSVTAGDQWSQNWSVVPLQDPGQLLRLRALYRFGAGLIDRGEFACEYPLVQSVSAPSQDGDPSSGLKYRYPRDVVTKCQQTNDAAPNVGSPDPAFLRQPDCIICDTSPATAQSTNRVYANASGPVLDHVEPPLSVGDTLYGFCLETSPKIKSISKGNPVILTLDKPATCDQERKIYGGPMQGAQSALPYKLTLVKGKNTVVVTTYLSTNLVGSSVVSDCFPASTKIVFVDQAAQTVNLNQFSTCPAHSPTRVAISVSSKSIHFLSVNPRLSNTWLWFGDGSSQMAGGQLLGVFGGHGLFLVPSVTTSGSSTYNSQKEYSDFLVFVLEATLQSTSTATPSKAGAPQLIQRPAAATEFF